jgi:hypothetical protein
MAKIKIDDLSKKNKTLGADDMKKVKGGAGVGGGLGDKSVKGIKILKDVKIAPGGNVANKGGTSYK